MTIAEKFPDGILLNGTPGDDLLVGGEGNDTIAAGTGADTIDAKGGDDLIDVTVTNERPDVVHGGDGTDTLRVTVVDVPEISGDAFMAKNMYWIGYDTLGNWLSQAGTDSGYRMADMDATASAASLMIATGYALAGVRFDNVENISVQASTAANSDDLLMVRGMGIYNAYGGSDSLYANWSSASLAIIWNNLASDVVQLVNGSSISNVERLLLKTGAGNDDLRNTVAFTDDEFETGAGNDTVFAGAGRDRVDAGSGDDLISIVIDREYADSIDGGTGNDTLVLTVTSTEPALSGIRGMVWSGYDAGGNWTGQAFSGPDTRMADVDTILSGKTLWLATSSTNSGAWITGIEHFSMLAPTGNDSDDLLLALGNGPATFNAYGGNDALYANWSDASSAIAWDNLASDAVQIVNSASISNIERLLLKTGAGNDYLRNTAVATNDEFDTGAGNDTVFAGDGDDQVRGGAGNDMIDGGGGLDTAVFSGSWIDYEAVRNAAGTLYIVSSQAEGVDRITNVETFRFADNYVGAASFAPVDSKAPVVTGLSPTNGAAGVSPNANIVLTFDERVVAGSGNLVLRTAAGDTVATWNVADSPAVSVSEHALTINPAFALDKNTRYVLDVPAAAVSDLIGNPYAGTNTYAFTTTADRAALLVNELPAAKASVGSPFHYDIPVNTFIDQNPGESLSYRASLADGKALPAWLSVNAITGRMSGTPATGDAGLLDVRLTATDMHGTWASDDFSLLVSGAATGVLPYLEQSIPDISVTAGRPFEFTVPDHTLVASDGSALTWSAALANGGALPQWMSLNSYYGTFAGTPSAANVGLYLIHVTGTTGGYGASDDFVIAVGSGSTPPAGTAGPDARVGSTAGETIVGGAGNDTLYGGAGNDSIDGAAGLDEAWLGSMRGMNTVTKTAGADLSVVGPEGADTLYAIERLVFSDVAVAFDTDGTGGKAYRLYQAAFDRPPDEGGLGFWMYYLDHGFDFTSAANNFLNSDEFRAMYGQNPANTEFVRLLYMHVLQREPDAEGYRFWNAAMTNEGNAYGHAWTRGEVLVLFSESAENQANVIGQIENGFSYQPFHG